MHEGGVHDPRQFSQISKIKDSRARRERRQREKPKNSKKNINFRSPCSLTRKKRCVEKYGVWGKKKFMGQTFTRERSALRS